MARDETSRHLEAFELFYANRRDFATSSDKLRLNRATLYRWADRYNWAERADARDQSASALADTEATRKTAAFLTAQGEAGEMLRRKGIHHLMDHDITDGRTAITAIKTGLELERQALGMPDWIVKILSADAAAISAEIEALERRGAGGTNNYLMDE